MEGHASLARWSLLGMCTAVLAACTASAAPSAPASSLPAAPTGGPRRPEASQIPTIPTSATLQIVAVPPAGSLYQGVFPGGLSGEEDDITPRDLRAYEQAVGKSAAWVYFSDNWYRGRAFPLATATWIRDAGCIPFIRLMMRSDPYQNHAEPTFTLDRIAGGAFDDDLRSWMREAYAFGTPLLVEFGTEANGRWFPWNGIWNGGGALNGFGDAAQPDGPERFRTAYRHIIQIARDEGAVNIQWAFHVNNGDNPEEDWNRLENYYPGDEWIDWIGVSAYGASSALDSEYPSFREQMDAAYPRLAALSPNKPIVVLEFGTALGNPAMKQAEWAQQALKDLASLRWPRIIGFSWWNERWANDGDSTHDTSMRLQENPQLAAAFSELVGENPRILGRVVTGIP